FLLLPLTPGAKLLPYTTLFRSKEEFAARLMAIAEKHRRKAAEAKPLTAEEKAKEKFAPSLEAVVKANAQSNRRVLERTREELERSEEHTSELQSRGHLV